MLSHGDLLVKPGYSQKKYKYSPRSTTKKCESKSSALQQEK